MLPTDTLALVFLLLALGMHLLSIGLAIYRNCQPWSADGFDVLPPVSLIRPVCGIDTYDALTLQSSFDLSHSPLEVIFCCASARDPAVPLVQDLMKRSPNVDAKLLVGDDNSTANPKLNNLIKGWSAARRPWVVLSDSNVLLPKHYIQSLLSVWNYDTGLVCSPPVGCLPEGFWAEIECAFLNTYQARWQLAADTIGLGFAQGKSMLWRRELLEAVGGIQALGSEIAEDAAATKIVRDMGLRVRLVDRPFPQPLGKRTAKQVLARQIRWAKLRRATFPVYFVPELLTGVVPPLLAVPFAARALEMDVWLLGVGVAGSWYASEALLNTIARWPFSKWTPIAWLARDLVLPALWISAWAGNDFSWRGTKMSVSEPVARTGS